MIFDVCVISILTLCVTDYYTQMLKEIAVGEYHATVISFDLALYEKVVQQLDASLDLKGKIVSRRGQLHVVMAAQRNVGSPIENSDIDDAWLEADVYGPSTTRQIIKCTH